MDKKQKSQMYEEFLRGEGYLPQIDADGDVVFKAEGKVYLIIIDERDEEFFRIAFPNFWPIESPEERAKVTQAALDATASTKVAKVFPVQDNVWATIELFCLPPENFKLVFRRSFSALQSAVTTFVGKMRA
ncbi:MAG: hypothetical protein RBT47_05815 [Anaerolineae bacterium]|jgi:hypothetical protein|nr:hypothetical protein [Anaerolineae bacterium]